jgi:hypothetical protein
MNIGRIVGEFEARPMQEPDLAELDLPAEPAGASTRPASDVDAPP